MPVLSENESRDPSIYLLLGCALIILCIFLRQKSKHRIIMSGSSSTNTSSSSDEKSQSHQPSPRIPHSKSPQQKSPTYQDFPPTLASQTQSFVSSPSIANQDFTSQNFVSSPITYTKPQFPPAFPLPTSRSYDSATMPSNAEIPTSKTQSSDPNVSAEVELPRRRSYTKTTAQGTPLEGQIEMNESWRRHTRVFGGGVCKACEESEERRRMSA